MPFACCFACGNVSTLPSAGPDYGKPAGPCPKCRNRMYSAVVPFPELAARQMSVRVRGAHYTGALK